MMFPRLYQTVARISSQTKSQNVPSRFWNISPLTSEMAQLQEATIERCRPMMKTLQKSFPANATLAQIQSLYSNGKFLCQFYHHGALALKMAQLATDTESPGLKINSSDHLTLATVLSLLNLGFHVHHRLQAHPSDDHSSSKLLILFGDHLLTQPLPLLSASSQSSALLDLSATVSENLSEGFYSLADKDTSVENGTVADWQSRHYGLNVQQFALGCRCALQLASVTSEAHLQAAFDFGLNYGYAFVASTEEALGESDLPIGTLATLQKQYSEKAMESLRKLPFNGLAKDTLLSLLQ